jgi:hypothetical protein
MEEGKMVANHTHLKIYKENPCAACPHLGIKINSHDDMNIQLCLTDEQLGDSPCLLITFL